MSKAKASTIPPDRLAAYDSLIATIPGHKRRGAAMAYTSLNGRMFSYMNAEGVLALRLPPAEREAFMQQYGAPLHQAYGVVQKEYVTIPAAVLYDTGALKSYFRGGHDFVAGLKPKPTKRG
jgi:hypothetical protein